MCVCLDSLGIHGLVGMMYVRVFGLSRYTNVVDMADGSTQTLVPFLGRVCADDLLCAFVCLHRLECFLFCMQRERVKREDTEKPKFLEAIAHMPKPLDQTRDLCVAEKPTVLV